MRLQQFRCFPMVHAAMKALSHVHTSDLTLPVAHTSPAPCSMLPCAPVQLSFRTLTERWMVARPLPRAGVNSVTARPPVFRDLREEPARPGPSPTRGTPYALPETHCKQNADSTDSIRAAASTAEGTPPKSGSVQSAPASRARPGGQHGGGTTWPHGAGRCDHKGIHHFHVTQHQTN